MQPAAASISTKVLWRVGSFCPILAAADCKPVDAILKMKIIIGAM